MKVGIVPSTLLTSMWLNARHYLGATKRQVEQQRAVVQRKERALALSQRKLVDLEKSFDEGAMLGVVVVKP